MFLLVLMVLADSGCKSGRSEGWRIGDVIVLAFFAEHSIGVWPVSELLGRQIKNLTFSSPSILHQFLTEDQDETGVVKSM